MADDLDAFYAELDQITPAADDAGGDGAGGDAGGDAGVAVATSAATSTAPPSSGGGGGSSSSAAAAPAPAPAAAPAVSASAAAPVAAAAAAKKPALGGALPRSMIVAKAAIMRPAVITRPPQPAAAAAPSSASNSSAAAAYPQHYHPYGALPPVPYGSGPAVTSSLAYPGGGAGGLPLQPPPPPPPLPDAGSSPSSSAAASGASYYEAGIGATVHEGVSVGPSLLVPSHHAGGGGGGADGGGTHAAGAKRKAPEDDTLRACAGKVWADKTLTEWPENDFRLFCGDLGNEVSDEGLAAPFRARYRSFAKAKVVRDAKSHKSRGYGFVSFTDAADALAALKEMNGQYIGNRPVSLKRADTASKSLGEVKKRQREEDAALRAAQRSVGGGFRR